MALMCCVECGKEVSSRASSCPNCGCPIDAGFFEPVLSTNQENNNIMKYIEIAQSALKGNNGDEAYQYANKTLDIDPRNILALEIKMLSLQLLSTMGNTRTHEIIECGSKAIKFSSTENKQNTADKVYAYFLNRALELLTVANSKIRDTGYVQRIFQNYILVGPLSASNNAVAADARLVDVTENLSNDALLLKSSVPQSLIHDIDKYQALAVSIANAYFQYSEGLQERYKIYGASLTPEAHCARENILRSFSIGIATPEEIEYRSRKEKEQYWIEHPEEKDRLIKMSGTILEEIARLEDSFKRLSLFKINERSKIQTKINDFRKELQRIQTTLYGL